MKQAAPDLAPPRRTGSLASALGIRTRGVSVFVGAGGKTSAIRRLLLERPGAYATTTTHLGRGGFGVGTLAAAVDAGLLHALATAMAGARPLTLAGADHGARLAAPPLAWQYAFLRGRRRALVFVEADGARRRFVKLPELHEPAWPAIAAATAVVVVGAGALGEPIATAGHRPQAFARAGLRGKRVTERHLLAMVRAYLERVPPRAPIVVLLSGVESPAAPFVARLARTTLALVRERDPKLRDPHVPVRIVVAPDLATGPFWHWAWARRAPRRRAELPGVCGVLLAAGSGTRYGRPSGDVASKLLVRWRGRPLVAHAARAWARAGFAARVAVTGYARQEVEPILRGERAGGKGRPEFVCVRNPHFERGLGTSVRAAARHAPDGLGLLFLHADMPAQSVRTLREIAALGSALRRRIVVPTVAGAPVHPIYFPADLRRALTRVADASGGKPVIDAHPERVLYLPQDERASEFHDVDRPADLRRLPAKRPAPGRRRPRRRKRGEP